MWEKVKLYCDFGAHRRCIPTAKHHRLDFFWTICKFKMFSPDCHVCSYDKKTGKIRKELKLDVHLKLFLRQYC